MDEHSRPFEVASAHSARGPIGWMCLFLSLASLSLSAQTAITQEAGGGLARDAAAAEPPVLADKQGQVIERYRRLEELLLRLADVEADENPERAALLRRAARQSRDTFVLEKLTAAGDSLKLEQFAKAIESQGAAKEGLDKLLTLLLSEDRPQRIRDEKKRIANMIKELKVVERLQRSTRARTENGAQLPDVAEEQAKIGDRSEKVNEDLKADQAPKSSEQPGEPKPGKPSRPSAEAPSQSNDGENKPDDAEKGEPKPDAEAKPGDEPKPAEMKSPAPGQETQPPSDSPQPSKATPQDSPSQPSQSSEGESKQDTPSESQPSPSQSAPPGQPSGEPPSAQPPKSPEQEAQSQLDKALQEMRQAEKELEDAQRQQAVERQKKAEENLRAAIDRLEKILRQLREEEMQRELARLESRLRKMAQMQGKVLDDTKALAAIPESQRDRQVDLKSGNLAFEQKKIVLEADRAMLLLREEGSSVAFPEVMSQIRGDMQRVAERLATTKIEAVTIGIQDDILAALEEMIAALQQAQRDLEKKKQEQQQGSGQSGGEQGEQPLVEQIAELKLIRTMEMRIKSTTERYAGMIDEQPTANADMVPLLRDLSERQSNLYRVTRDLVLKRNQ